MVEQEAEAEELKEDGRGREEEGGAAIEAPLLGRVKGRNRAFGRLSQCDKNCQTKCSCCILI